MNRIMKAEEKNQLYREIRFYACLIFGATLTFLGIFLPPIGIIHNSVLIASGLFLSLGALVVGVDLKGCIHELVQLKNGILTNNTDNEESK